MSAQRRKRRIKISVAYFSCKVSSILQLLGKIINRTKHFPNLVIAYFMFCSADNFSFTEIIYDTADLINWLNDLSCHIHGKKDAYKNYGNSKNCDQYS